MSENSKCPYVISDLMQSWLLEVIEADEDESGLCEEGETKEVWWGEKERKRGEEIRERPMFSCISVLDSCLLDDRIKESLNVTSELYFDINMPETALWARSLYTQHAQCKVEKNKAFHLCYERLEVGVDSSNGAALAAYFWGHFTAAEAHCQYKAICSQTSHYRIVTRNFGVRFLTKHTQSITAHCVAASLLKE